MTQAIIPGCEENPDPTTVINVDPTKPMKEIPMDELKRDCDTDKKMQDSFDTLLVSSANAAENGRELLEENKRLNEECEQLVRRNHELYDELAALRGDSPKMKEVLEEFDIKDASDLEGKMNLLVYDEDILEKHGIADREELDERLDACGRATLRSALNTIGFNVSVVSSGWRMSASSGQEMLVKLVDNPLLDNNIAKLDCEASPDITNGSLCLSDIRIVIYV